MDWSFLYYIASVSTAYVGFTTIFIALRNVTGSGVDDHTTWSTRYLIAVALSTIAAALIPPALTALFGDVNYAIRLSSFLALILMGRLDLIYLWRRPMVCTQPLDWRLKILFVLAVIIDFLFGAIALGKIQKYQIGLYFALELSEVLLMFCYFAWVLERLLPHRWEARSQTHSAGPTIRVKE